MASPLPLPDLEPEVPERAPARAPARPQKSRPRTPVRPPRPEVRAPRPDPRTDNRGRTGTGATQAGPRQARPERPRPDRLGEDETSGARRPRPDRQVAPASFPARLGGAAIDALVLLVGSGLIVAWLTARDFRTTQVRLDALTGEQSVIAGGTTSPWVVAGIPLLLTAAYMILLIGLWGRTLGGWAVGIRCVPVDPASGAPVPYARPGLIVGARRWLLLYGVAGALSLLPVVGGLAWVLVLVVGLSPLWDRSGRLRGWQDRFAGDAVVRA